jgi:CheY-like chemotaxis protein
VYLPAVSGAATVAAPAAAAPPPAGQETILLVEDELEVCAVATQGLRIHGYTVLEASRPDEALDLARTHGAPIDLLVTDVVMPGMNGVEVARLVTGMRPETRILYISGYTDLAALRHDLLASGQAFLQKPFTGDTLARKVREVLDARAQDAPEAGRDPSQEGRR